MRRVGGAFRTNVIIRRANIFAQCANYGLFLAYSCRVIKALLAPCGAAATELVLYRTPSGKERERKEKRELIPIF